MSKTAVIYWSGTGNTEMMAKAIAEGAGADLFSVSEFSGNIADYDRIAFGCAAMGAEVLEEDEFEPFLQQLRIRFRERLLLFSALMAGVTANGCVIGKSVLRLTEQFFLVTKDLL